MFRIIAFNSHLLPSLMQSCNYQENYGKLYWACPRTHLCSIGALNMGLQNFWKNSKFYMHKLKPNHHIIGMKENQYFNKLNCMKFSKSIVTLSNAISVVSDNSLCFWKILTRKYQTITDDEEKLEIQFSRLTLVDFRTSGFKLCIHLLIKLKKKQWTNSKANKKVAFCVDWKQRKLIDMFFIHFYVCTKCLLQSMFCGTCNHTQIQ